MYTRGYTHCESMFRMNEGDDQFSATIFFSFSFLVRAKNNNREMTKNAGKSKNICPHRRRETRSEREWKVERNSFIFFSFFFPFLFLFFWGEFDAYARATLNVLEEKFSRYDSSTWCKRGQWNTVQVENLRRGRAVKTRRTITNHSGGCRWSGADYFQPFNSFHSVTFLSFPLCMRYMCILFSYSTFHTRTHSQGFQTFRVPVFSGGY